MDTRRIGALKYIRLGKTLYLTHFPFVDDVLLFCDGFGRDSGN
jgi:hypothetical protein